jgi:hypothetical protein
VGLIDHRLRVGEPNGLEVEAVDPARVRTIDPDARSREIEVAQALNVGFDLGLILVFVAPDPRTEGPRRGQVRGAGHRVVVAGDVERVLGGEQVKVQARVGVGSGAEGRTHAIVGARGHVEGRGVIVVDIESPAARAGQKRDRHVGLVGAALEREVELEL